MPVVCRSRASSRSREAAQAAVGVADPACGRRSRRCRSGPGCRCTCAAAASRRARCRRAKRLPMTRSSPSRSRSTNAVEAGEVVAVVGIAHDDEAAARGPDPAVQRVAVALLGDRHDARACPFGDLLRAVGAAVVGDRRPRRRSRPARGTRAPWRRRSRASPPHSGRASRSSARTLSTPHPAYCRPSPGSRRERCLWFARRMVSLGPRASRHPRLRAWKSAFAEAATTPGRRGRRPPPRPVRPAGRRSSPSARVRLDR